MNEIENYFDEVIPKHKKKSKKTKTKQSNHKHNYGLCYLFNNSNYGIYFWNVYEYCTICGRIGNSKDNYWNAFHNARVRFGDLPIATVKIAQDKYINLNELKTYDEILELKSGGVKV